eukprot:85493_1
MGNLSNSPKSVNDLVFPLTYDERVSRLISGSIRSCYIQQKRSRMNFVYNGYIPQEILRLCHSYIGNKMDIKSNTEIEILKEQEKLKLIEELHKPIKVKITVVGDGGVGKTSIIRRFCWDMFEHEWYDPCMEEYYRKQIEVDSEIFDVELIDTHGQEEFCVLRDEWLRVSDYMLWVYSINRRETFEEVQIWPELQQR